MSEAYTGVHVEENLDPEFLNKLYKNKTLPTSYLDSTKIWYPNMFVVAKAQGQQSALTRVSLDSQSLELIDPKISAAGITARNKEQAMALSVLLDPAVPLNIMTGPAGTGKSLLALCAAITLLEKGKYDRLILTRPMSQVGRHSLGALPGDVNDKFNPYLINYTSNLEQLIGKKSVEDAVQQYGIEFIPIQLLRGASFFNSLIIVDEIQTADRHETLTIGTRVGDKCKIVMSGDLNQRDENIPREKTGLHQLMQNQQVKESHLASAIELLKIERSQIASLFANVLGG